MKKTRHNKQGRRKCFNILALSFGFGYMCEYKVIRKNTE